MSKVLLVCLRNRAVPEKLQQIVETLIRRMTPDNIDPQSAQLFRGDGIMAAIQNPVEGLLTSQAAICLGTLIDPPPEWAQPGTPVPEGSFVLYRWDAHTVELLTDVVASRTIWYAMTDVFFAASSSQRAIIALLGDHQPNLSAFTWMVSSGSLGPANSWDRRLRSLEPDARLVLDRDAWTIRVTRRPIVFRTEEMPAAEHRRRLEQDLESVFERFHPDPSRWVGLLSGGYDSRAILAKLKDRGRYRFITWGVRAAQEDPAGDAAVARALAERFGVRHDYMTTDLDAAEPVETIFERFLTAGEGRVDHISGYADGFHIWKRLYEGDVSGVLRGDEGFGWHPVNSAFAVRYSLGAILFSDYANLVSPEAIGLDGMPAPALPEDLRQQAGESLATWRDRLYHEFRLPVVLAALNDFKSAYVEVSSPLLSRCLIERVRTLPDELRTGKALWKSIVDDLVPGAGYARRAAIESARDVLRAPQVVEAITSELSTSQAQETLSGAFLDRVLSQIQSDPDEGGKPTRRNSWRSSLAGLLPPRIKNALKRTGARPDLDPYQMAFRTYLICRMERLIAEDAGTFPRDWSGAQGKGEK